MGSNAGSTDENLIAWDVFAVATFPSHEERPGTFTAVPTLGLVAWKCQYAAEFSHLH